jgi:hypothetical protein
VNGGNVKNGLKLRVLSSFVLLGAAWLLAGCKSAPPLATDQATALIQSNYDQSPGQPFNISVDDRGMQLGVNAKYWAGTRRYPNGFWGDFTLTPDGKKVVKLPNGGDTIQWRPESPNDPHYAVIVEPLMPSHLKARDIGDVQTVGDERTVSFTEVVDLTGMPDALQTIAHDPGNKLTTQRQATFVLDNGAWKLKSVD